MDPCRSCERACRCGSAEHPRRPSWSSYPAQRDAPLGATISEGEVSITDPCHPLFGRSFKLVGIACVPGHIRQCQVELFPGVYGRIPVAATNLSTVRRPKPTVLTLPGLEELVACFLALPVVRRTCHATDRKPKRVGSSIQRSASRRDRRSPSHPHGGGGK